MARDLKSIKADWQRWSRTERAVAIALVVVVATLMLGGPIGGTFL